MELAHLGERVRELKSSGLEEGVSARLLIYAGQLDRARVSLRATRVQATVVLGLSDDRETQARSPRSFGRSSPEDSDVEGDP